MEIVVKDGVKYLPYQYKDELELENLVRKHIEFIFGNNSLFFDKSKIKSKSGIGSIPDGFVLLPLEQKWYIIEVELSQHPLHEHIVPQISKFNSAIKNPVTKRKIIDAFEEEIENNPNLNYKYKSTGIKKERYKLLTEVINKSPEIVIIIDKKTKELEDVCDSLPFASKIIRFKTYKRESSNVMVHMFDTLVSYSIENKEEEFVIEKPTISKDKTQSRGNKTLNQILGVANLVLSQGKSYNEAIKIIAKERNINEATVRDKCTRRINLDTAGFQDLLKDKEKLINFLVEIFSSEKENVKVKLKSNRFV